MLNFELNWIASNKIFNCKVAAKREKFWVKDCDGNLHKRFLNVKKMKTIKCGKGQMRPIAVMVGKFVFEMTLI